MIAPSKIALFSRLGEVTAEEAIFRVISSVMFLLNGCLTVVMFYHIISVICVAFHISPVEAWPPMYGDLRNAYTVRRFWR